MSRIPVPTFLEPGKIDKFEVGLRLEFQQTEYEAVGKTDFLVAIERYSKIVVIHGVFERYDIIHTKNPHWPSRYDPLDRLGFTQKDGLT